MGIVRPRGRDVVCLSTDAVEREGRWAWTEALVVGESPAVVPAPVGDRVTTAGATQSAADRTRVRRDPRSEGERTRAS